MENTDSIAFGKVQIDAAAASLVSLDVSGLGPSIQICRDELCARPEARLELHPRRLEEVVASVYGDLGFVAELTAYHSDGGIDVYLRSESGERVAVQVKRYRGAIGVEQIRSFAGAMILRDVLKGVFLTTSCFTRGAEAEAIRAGSIGMPIELVDAKRLFEYLRLAQVKKRRNMRLEDLVPDPSSIETGPVWMEAFKG